MSWSLGVEIVGEEFGFRTYCSEFYSYLMEVKFRGEFGFRVDVVTGLGRCGWRERVLYVRRG